MILDLQRRLAEVGRIRIGQTVPIGKSGKTRPTKLDTFRLTSPDPNRIQAAAKLYGGQPAQWTAPAGPQYEVITQSSALPVVVPPSDLGFSQWYELWSGGGCLRRCDGRYASYQQDNTMVEGECQCDPDKRECTIHTRLSVMLRDLPGLGLWRLDTQGWNAALELQGAVDVLQMAAGAGTMLPAQLRLEQRMVKRPGQTTRRFAVPVLDVEITPAALIGATTYLELTPAAPTSNSNGNNTLTPVPDNPHWPKPTVAEQITPPEPPRRRGQAPIPATGLAPRTAKQAALTPPPDLAGSQAPTPGANLHDSNREEAPSDPASQTHDDVVDLTPEQLNTLTPLTLDDELEVRLITPKQLTKLSIDLEQAGFTDSPSARAFVAEIIGHTIGSRKDLTFDEASRVIDILENQPDDTEPGE